MDRGKFLGVLPVLPAALVTQTQAEEGPTRELRWELDERGLKTNLQQAHITPDGKKIWRPIDDAETKA